MANPIGIQEIFGATGNASYGVTMVSHGTNGVVGYAVGTMALKSIARYGSCWRSSTLTTGSGSLLASFSDRKRNIDPEPSGGIGSVPRQPFDEQNKDEIGLAIYENGLLSSRWGGEDAHRYGATLTFRSWDGGRMSIGLDAVGDFLVGVSPTVGGVQSSFTPSFRTIDLPR